MCPEQNQKENPLKLEADKIGQPNFNENKNYQSLKTEQYEKKFYSIPKIYNSLKLQNRCKCKQNNNNMAFSNGKVETN